MTPRLPLYTKLLGWFFLNLVVLGALLWLFARAALPFDAMMAGAAGDNVQKVAAVILGELDHRSPTEWHDILNRFAATYDVTFSLVREDGTPLAGPPLELPPEVAARLRGRPNLPRAPQGSGADRDRVPRGFGPSDDETRPRRGLAGGRGLAGRRVFLHTRAPDRYWAIFPAWVRSPAGGPPQAARLLVVSPSLSGGGLFFNFTPWYLAAGAAALLSALWWLPFARSLTKTISEMTAASERLAEGRFDAHVRARRRDELGQLGQSINRMAKRLEGLVSGQKRFLGDIAHELCAPLARLQMALGILDQRADAKQKPCVDDLREEVEHMSNLVNELLSFSKASLGRGRLQLQAVPLADVAQKALRREAAPDQDLRLDIPDDLCAQADPDLLQRALANVVRNAIRYAGAAGPITLAARRDGDKVRLTVSDCGPGVPESALPHIFDPFYRVDPSRARETGGTGLGLAIVKTCLEACGGTVTAQNRQPSGLIVTITLPPGEPSASPHGEAVQASAPRRPEIPGRPP
jgi:two-component system sensor histidine kinase CpxA